MDRIYTRLVNFIHDRFPHSRPSTAAHVPPRCEFEDFFSIMILLRRLDRILRSTPR